MMKKRKDTNNDLRNGRKEKPNLNLKRNNMNLKRSY
jgi:hypothetical protein